MADEYRWFSSQLRWGTTLRGVCIGVCSQKVRATDPDKMGVSFIFGRTPSPPYRALSSPLTLFKSQTSAMSMLAVPMMTGPQPGLRKKAKQGMRSYPVGTIASTVPIAGGALKVVVSFIRTDGSRARTAPLVFGNRRCSDRQQDSCRNSCAPAPVFGPLGGHGGWNHWLPAREGIDNPFGEACPQCPYWKGRDRFTGELESG